MLLADLNAVVNTTRTELNNPEWETLYADYVTAIHANLDHLKKIRSSFKEWSPLTVHINITNAKMAKTTRTAALDLRYRGQKVADMRCKEKGGTIEIKLSTEGYNANNKAHFNCDITLNKDNWRGPKAREFRNHFKKTLPGRKKAVNGRDNEEHRLESLFITEFSKKSSKGKALLGIQPVMLDNLKFPMPTPLSASKGTVKYAKYHDKKMRPIVKGGGIDLLARTGTGGRATYLCIMELKDENKPKEPPIEALKQALAYTTFMRELLRSACGPAWWKLFGFKGAIPKNLKLYAVCVMPANGYTDKSFKGMELTIGCDIIKLHYIYFIEKSSVIKIVDTSLNI